MKRFGRAAQGAAQTPEMQAAQWLARRELRLGRRDEPAPADPAALLRLQAVLDSALASASAPGIGRMRAEALARTRRAPVLPGNVRVSVAAAALLAVFAVTFVLMDGARDPADFAHSGDFYETHKGETRAVTLSDGSTLKLDTGTRAQVVLTRERRSVRVLQGQVWFDVARDKERPFTVASGPLEVTALGTQFDVRTDRQGTTVVLVEGKVRVEPLARRGLSRLLPMLGRHELDPGQQLSMSDNGPVKIASADVEQTTSWLHGRLIFRGEPLSFAIAEFNRYSEHQLRLDDPMLGALAINGVFSIAHPENFLAAISEFYPIRIERRSPRLSVLVARPE